MARVRALGSINKTCIYVVIGQCMVNYDQDSSSADKKIGGHVYNKRSSSVWQFCNYFVTFRVLVAIIFLKFRTKILFLFSVVAVFAAAAVVVIVAVVADVAVVVES